MSARFSMCKSLEAIYFSEYKNKQRLRAANQWKKGSLNYIISEVLFNKHIHSEHCYEIRSQKTPKENHSIQVVIYIKIIIRQH